MDSAFSYLNFIKFSNISRWDVKRFNLESEFANESWVCLNKILEPYKKTLLKPELIDNKIQIISKINFAGNLFLRPLTDVKDFKSTLFEIPAECLIYSKINVRHGCTYFNKTGRTIAGTSEYPVFKIKKDLVDGEYLQKILRTNYIKKYLSSKTTGFSKTRVQIEEFLNTRIPLPSLSKQREIVEKYNAKIKLAEEQEQKIKILEKEIEDLWTNTLGLEFVELNYKETKTSFLNFAFLSQLTRWDIYNNTNDVKSIKYKFSKLKDIVIGKPLYGAGEKGVKNKSDVRYIRITDINEDGTLNDDFVSAEKVEEKYILKENDFLIARSGNTVGKTFLYKNEYGKCLYAGYLIKFELDINKIIPEYILYYTKSKAYKTWILSNQRANAQPNINSEEYLNSPIIIPDLATQKDLVNKISKIKTTIKNLKNSSEQNIISAQEEFEKELFE